MRKKYELKPNPDMLPDRYLTETENGRKVYICGQCGNPIKNVQYAKRCSFCKYPLTEESENRYA